MFGHIVDLALKRKEEVLEELRTKAEKERDILMDQTAHFETLAMSAGNAAAFGKRLAEIGIGKHILGHKPDMQKLCCDLSQLMSCDVKYGPIFKVSRLACLSGSSSCWKYS